MICFFMLFSRLINNRCQYHRNNFVPLIVLTSKYGILNLRILKCNSSTISNRNTWPFKQCQNKQCFSVKKCVKTVNNVESNSWSVVCWNDSQLSTEHNLWNNFVSLLLIKVAKRLWKRSFNLSSTQSHVIKTIFFV